MHGIEEESHRGDGSERNLILIVFKLLSDYVLKKKRIFIRSY